MSAGGYRVGAGWSSLPGGKRRKGRRVQGGGWFTGGVREKDAASAAGEGRGGAVGGFLVYRRGKREEWRAQQGCRVGGWPRYGYRRARRWGERRRGRCDTGAGESGYRVAGTGVGERGERGGVAVGRLGRDTGGCLPTCQLFDFSTCWKVGKLESWRGGPEEAREVRVGG